MKAKLKVPRRYSNKKDATATIEFKKKLKNLLSSALWLYQIRVSYPHYDGKKNHSLVFFSNPQHKQRNLTEKLSSISRNLANLAISKQVNIFALARRARA